jgi:hypothetical protein
MGIDGVPRMEKAASMEGPKGVQKRIRDIGQGDVLLDVYGVDRAAIVSVDSDRGGVTIRVKGIDEPIHYDPDDMDETRLVLVEESKH